MLDRNFIEQIYENYVFPYWYDNWSAQGIDETRENVENVYNRIQTIDGNNISEDLVTINIALNTVHQSGSMLDYVDEYAQESLSYKFLEQMSNLGNKTEEWDEELRSIGVTLGEKHVELV